MDRTGSSGPTEVSGLMSKRRGPWLVIAVVIALVGACSPQSGLVVNLDASQETVLIVEAPGTLRAVNRGPEKMGMWFRSTAGEVDQVIIPQGESASRLCGDGVMILIRTDKDLPASAYFSGIAVESVSAAQWHARVGE